MAARTGGLLLSKFSKAALEWASYRSTREGVPPLLNRGFSTRTSSESSASGEGNNRMTPPIPGRRDSTRVSGAEALSTGGPSQSPADRPLSKGTKAARSSKASPRKSAATAVATRALPKTSDLDEPQWAASIVDGRALQQAYLHPRTHNVPAATLHFRAHFPSLVDLSSHVALHAAAALGIPCSNIVSLPTKRTLWTVPRGPFVHKKSQENFERKVHKRMIKAWDAHPDVVDKWVAYLGLHPVPGVGMRAVKWYRAPVDRARRPMHPFIQARSKAKTTQETVRELAKQIIEVESRAAVSEFAHEDVKEGVKGAAGNKPVSQTTTTPASS